jgi:myo-inositol-1(or 4)-monophosphatase
MLNNINKLLNDLSLFLLDRKNFSIKSMNLKLDQSPVSSVDLAIQSRVSELMSKYLGDTILVSEEELIPAGWISERNFLVLDPVDGTENFISGVPIWATGLAFFENRKILASAIFFPEMNMLAKTNNVGFENEVMFTPFRTSHATTRIKGFSSNSDWENQINEFGIENRIFGSSLFNLTLAANGVIEYKSSTKGVRFWDIAPALAIALEKNMEVVINGEPYVGQILDPNSRFVTTIRTK